MGKLLQVVMMINNNLKTCRESLEMTQKELGYIFGVAESTVSGWENNNDIMPLTKLFKFCELYGFSLDYVTGLSNKNISYNKINKLNKVTIGNNLKAIRKRLELTQSKIAKYCMISQTTYSNYELGRNLITTLTLYTLCKKYNLSMDEIIGRKK